jgi:putative transposase
LYQDAENRKLVAEKERWSKDYLHKLSKALVQHCLERGIEVIVIGRSKGWKQEQAHGTVQNRKFCQIAHATLIALIKYKAESMGIAVVTTEESYTSKASFVNGDLLEVYGEEHKTRGVNAKIPSWTVETASEKVSTTSRPAITGTRPEKERNKFIHTNPIGRWNVVHADVNGAFNIIRKIFKSFKYHIGLTLKYTLWRLSPRLGCVPLQI